MSAPEVSFGEVDLSTRVPSFPGVYTSIIIPGAAKGKRGTFRLVTSETDFLNKYTPDGRIEIGYDLAYFSALAILQKTNKLWVGVPDNDSLYGGVSVISGASPSITALASGIDIPEDHEFGIDEAFILVGANQGSWNNKISIRFRDNSVKEPESFIIEVFKGSSLVESHVVSRVEGKKDGYNRNIFIEDALESSNYIRAINNPAVPENAVVKFDTLTTFAGGTDGTATTDGQMILLLDQLKNVDSIPLTLLCDGGRATPAYQRALIEVAETRKDCVALLSAPYSAEASADYLNAIVEYRNTELNANTSYAVMYSTHQKVYDKFNDRSIYVSPEGYAAALISATAANQEIWYPVGGFRRGMLNVIDTKRRFSKGEMDYLYDNGINPIRFTPGRGIVIWGQKTLLNRPSALDRLNVRLLLITIEPAIAEALEDFVFEFNDDTTRAIIRAMIDSYMANIKARRGVYDYYVVCNEDNNTPEDIDSNKLNVWLFVQPTKSAEFIKFTTAITRTGASFELAQQAL